MPPVSLSPDRAESVLLESEESQSEAVRVPADTSTHCLPCSLGPPGPPTCPVQHGGLEEHETRGSPAPGCSSQYAKKTLE